MRLTVEYSDQNESFARCLPRVGQTTASFISDAGTPGWFLLELEEPFDYRLKVGEVSRPREIVVTHFLLRSRWAAYDIGGAKPTPVFILLVEQGIVPQKGPIHVDDYVHIAWGMCTCDAGGV